jgi:MFS family permease
MVGVALVRKETLHFMLFAGHIVGYSIADTALASLISRYSAPATQGRDLAFNQAAQSCARVISPLLAGWISLSLSLSLSLSVFLSLSFSQSCARLKGPLLAGWTEA